MLWSRWTAGSDSETVNDVFVAVTMFRARRRRDMPGILWSGHLLQRRWAELPGSIGVWTWLDLRHNCTGSVSVWREESDMRAFVRWKPHVEIVRRHRQAGKMTSSSWTSPQLTRRAIRFSAEGLLTTWIAQG